MMKHSCYYWLRRNQLHLFPPSSYISRLHVVGFMCINQEKNTPPRMENTCWQVPRDEYLNIAFAWGINIPTLIASRFGVVIHRACFIYQFASYCKCTVCLNVVAVLHYRAYTGIYVLSIPFILWKKKIAWQLAQYSKLEWGHEKK